MAKKESSTKSFVLRVDAETMDAIEKWATSSYTLPTCPAGFQTSVQGLGHVPAGVGMSLAIPVEVKPCLNVSYNRSYQINEHYPCITQCFER